uniref:Secreted protein n=1 Tax=Glossina austeni TaxID=7395 RepID=A0A1A9VEI7_GLOAU
MHEMLQVLLLLPLPLLVASMTNKLHHLPIKSWEPLAECLLSKSSAKSERANLSKEEYMRDHACFTKEDKRPNASLRRKDVCVAISFANYIYCSQKVNENFSKSITSNV